MSEYFADILPRLPKLLTRQDIAIHFGTLISPRYLANLDSARKGPRRTRIGRKVVYIREDFIAWLEARMTLPPTAA